MATPAYNKDALAKKIKIASGNLNTYFQLAQGNPKRAAGSKILLAIAALTDEASNFNESIPQIAALDPKSSSEEVKNFKDLDIELFHKDQKASIEKNEKIIMDFFGKSDFKDKAQKEVNVLKKCISEIDVVFSSHMSNIKNEATGSKPKMK